MTERSDADRLRSMIERSGISQRALARALGVNERTVRRWVAGDSPIPRSAMLAAEHICRCAIKRS